MAKVNVNGKTFELKVEDDTPLLWVLRENFGLTGTKYGCGVGQCGACTIHINGKAQRSCQITFKDVKPTDRITTIEGLSPTGSHPVQKAWLQLEVAQCGFCQVGQIMAATALIAEKPNPTDQDIDQSITNICRCGTYQRVREGIKLAAQMSADDTRSRGVRRGGKA